ncbi:MULTISPECIES: SRPBCC family protein [Flavobacterium]|uniref:SRPBCC family protein n=2 Tax=Flavobacterium TaxID=237 RepID=A0A940XAD0_9FLAO|nr:MULTISPECIES: SRPBCC family protein [Flavobacterium]MBP4138817.1 SRPBCC family protein [Flavobacterium geliluteum]MDX6182516.1 SRPBCC family protein [Flavobacterium sp. Fl-33]MDX6185571.1 SRPBCC family protein [Flavobacterium sp. Fl-77]UFH38760.1 SRPBCC family protein [Flavobacterium sp. F-70]
MKIYKIETVQHLNTTIEECWNFFSSPRNLETITPDTMGFEIQDYDNKQMYPGQVITYTLKPLLGIKISWMTIITTSKTNEYFVDEQRFGPYALWHHKHFFEATDTGVKMTDVVHYALPLGFLGRIMNTLMVREKIKTIFAYRYNKIEELFNSKK